MISEERGWTEPGEREYPESDDSNCWPMPYTPVEGVLPGTLREDILCGQVVVAEATWGFGLDDTPVAPRIRSAAGWLPDLHVVGGRVEHMRDELLLPMTTIGDGVLPVPSSGEEFIEGGVPLMREYDELLARSALAGLQFLGDTDGTISTAATEVSEGALACGELAQWEDLEFIEALARQELRGAVEIRRSYVWFVARPADDILSHIPGPARFDLLEDVHERLREPRTRRQVTGLPLRSLALGEDPVPLTELDEHRHSVNDSWRSTDVPGLPYMPTSPPQLQEGPPMPQTHHDAVSVARLFTAAIEKAMATTKLGHASNSAERHRARHEAVAQYLLDHILRQEGELERFLEELGVRIEHEPVLHAEWEDRETGSRFDHVIEESAADRYRAVVVIEDKIDAQLAPDQLDRYCEFLAAEGGRATVVVLHPLRNPLNSAKNRVSDLQAKYAGVTVQFLTWAELSSRMIHTDPDGSTTGLWRALEEYAESVGTGDLEHLPGADALTDPVIAGELRDLFLTMQNVAAGVGSGRSRQLCFSFHGGNPEPWLQMAMSDNKRASVGLDLGLVRSPGTLMAGVRGPEDPDGYLTPAKVRVFRDGKLSEAAWKRVDELAELAVEVRDHGAHFPDTLPGRTTGKPVSEGSQDALRLIGAIFQAQAIKNPHRGGAPSSGTRGLNEGDGNERVGAVLVREDDEAERSVALFVGPPAGQDWTRATIWIRDERGDREIEVVPRETGRDYVLRVWETARHALGW
ncbi:MAG: PD-(D/E)XK nuclease family protein [Brachybacterium sp.]